MCTACLYNPLNTSNGTHELFQDVIDGNLGGDANLMSPLAAEPDGEIDFGVSDGQNTVSSGNQIIDGVLGGGQWVDLDLTFSFPDNTNDFGGDNLTAEFTWDLLLAEYSSFSEAEAIQVRNVLDEFSNVSGLTFTELDGPEGALDEDQEAEMRFMQSGYDGYYGFGGFPSWGTEDSGQVWINDQFSDFTAGGYGYYLVMHEIGHSVGLTHTFDGVTGGFGVIPEAYDNIEYTSMTYDFRLDDDAGYMQSMMIVDIAAIQHMYGANFEYRSDDTEYTFSQTTGQTFVNGQGQEAPDANVIFRSFWDGGGIDHYNLSNYTTDLSIDLRPGEVSDFDVNSSAQTVTHGSGLAQGQVYNPWLYLDDLRSLIENATGGSGDDELIGNQGQNTLAGGDGSDTLFGGAGEDRLQTGQGDRSFGEGGDDLFVLSDRDTGGNSTTVFGGETEEVTGDVLDLADLIDQTDFQMSDINYTSAESGDFTYRNALGETVSVRFAEIENVVCFTRGTQIETKFGPRAIEDLQVNDRIYTRGSGYQKIRWIGSRRLPAVGRFAPIMIKAGALANTRDLMVSPQHRMLIKDWRAELLFGEPEVLVAAKHLVNGDTIFLAEGGEVEYFHILFEAHQIISANGAPAESFHPGELGMDAMAEETREEILAIFPELCQDMETYGQIASASLKAHEALVLSAQGCGSTAKK